jgi:hypothetical protein
MHRANLVVLLSLRALKPERWAHSKNQAGRLQSRGNAVFFSSKPNSLLHIHSHPQHLPRQLQPAFRERLPAATPKL